MIVTPERAEAPDLISIARIARPHGIRGEVVADILTDFPARFETLEEVLAVRGKEIIGSLKIEKSRFHQDRLLLKFVGYDEPNKADELRGVSLVISPDELVELPENEYFIFDLVGCEVFTLDQQIIGVVVKVEDFGAAPLLVVKQDDREMMIPMTHEICPEIDTAAKRIVVNPPVGLLDL